MRDLLELNINEGGAPVARAPATPSAIAAFAAEYGIKIPEILLRLLRHSNGGHPELDSFLPGGPDERYPFGIDHFLFLDEDRDSCESMWKAMEFWRPVLGPSCLPFAEDGGGNVVFLDLTLDPPTVRVCWHDENFAQALLADSLEQFIDGLRINPDYI